MKTQMEAALVTNVNTGFRKTLNLYNQVSISMPKCSGCGNCVITCPKRAIRIAGPKLIVDLPKCNYCLECIEVCPKNAIACY